MSNWVRTENGGMSDLDQAVPWKDILDWQQKMFFYSCYLYYVLDDPKLSDDGFDRIIDVLEAYYDDLDDRIKDNCEKSKIKPNAHIFGHMLTNIEVEEALLWKNNG